MTKPITKVWTFPSGSAPGKTYETLQYNDGTTSCACPGWTRRVAADGTRSCKHTRLIDMGRADYVCVASKDYQAVKPSGSTPAKSKLSGSTPAAVKPQPKIEEPVKVIVRKISWR